MKVSIICTNFNKGDWVREAIDSFLNQETNFDFEIIIIDDASTDHSYEIIQEYQKKFPWKSSIGKMSSNISRSPSSKNH